MFAYLFRMLAFFVAISVVRSVIQTLVRAFRGTQLPRNPSPQGPPKTGPESAGAPSASTLLHQDPVCGTYVAASSSLRKICGGKVFHFCSEECRDRYVA
jgi:YHS domain-containing protein